MNPDAQLTTPHVLIIEPDAVLARIYATALAQAGMSACCAHSAQAAISAADEHTPDVILLELQLATHNGIAFLHELRSYPEWQTTPVVVHSYMAPQSYVAEEREALEENFGVTAWLYKPRTTLPRLVSVLQKTAELQRGSSMPSAKGMV